MPARRGARRAGRRAGRRTARRTVRRTTRRRRRRRMVLAGGMVLLAGSVAAYKISKKDADKIEQHTGQSVEELSEEDLAAAMKELGIQSIELDENDQALITDAAPEEPLAPAAPPPPPAPTAPPVDDQLSYIEELKELAALKEAGIVTEEEFEAKKKQLLGL